MPRKRETGFPFALTLVCRHLMLNLRAGAQEKKQI